MRRIDFFVIAGLFIIGLLSYQAAFSQENFSAGYIIDSNGDTLSGFIDYRNWDKNPENIRFKPNIDGNAKSFSPGEIIAFGVKDEIYVSAIIDAEVSPVRSDKLNDNPELKIQVDTAFLQALFRGDKSLYYYKNVEGRENFYIPQGDGFELLIYKKYHVERDGRGGIAENKKYLNQLALYLHDCATIQPKLKSTSYKLTGMVRLFQHYYKCSSSDPSYLKKPERAYIETGVLAGVSVTTLDFNGTSFPYLSEAEFDQSVNFATGLYMDIILPKNQGKWSVNNELFYTSYKVTGTYVESKSATFYETTTSEIGYSYIKINNMLRFKYPFGNVFLFVNAGISNGFAVLETNYKQRILTVSSTETITEGAAMDETRTYEQSFILGTGARCNKFSLEFRYENGNGMSAYSNLGSTANRLYFLLGYRF